MPTGAISDSGQFWNNNKEAGFVSQQVKTNLENAISASSSLQQGNSQKSFSSGNCLFLQVLILNFLNIYIYAYVFDYNIQSSSQCVVCLSIHSQVGVFLHDDDDEEYAWHSPQSQGKGSTSYWMLYILHKPMHSPS